MTRVPVDYNDEAALTAALKDQHVLIITLKVGTPKDIPPRLVKAAVAAGVQYIMPNAWGSDVRSDALALNDPDMFTAGVRAVCEEVNALGGTWISLACGFWYEFSLAFGETTFGVDVVKREATFFDDGKTYITTSTFPQCGRAVAGLLSLPVEKIKEWANRPLYIDSFRVNQREILDSVHRALGTTDKDWKITHVASKERYDSGVAAMMAGDRKGFGRAMYTRVMYPSGDGDYSKKLENEKVGLKEENLDEWTKWVVDKLESGWDPATDYGM